MNKILWFDIFSQSRLTIGRQCRLSCLECPIAEACGILSEPEDFAKLIQAGKTDEIIPPGKIIHLIGGDPLRYPDLPILLHTLWTYSKWVRLWTPGVISYEQWDVISPYISEVYLYCPAVTPSTYRAITGWDRFEELRDVIVFMKESKTNLTLQFPVTLESVQWLPEVHEFAKSMGTRLLIHYNHLLPFHKDTIAYIERYRLVPDVDVIAFRNRKRGFCDIPFAEHWAGWEKISFIAQELRNRLNRIFPI